MSPIGGAGKGLRGAAGFQRPTEVPGPIEPTDSRFYTDEQGPPDRPTTEAEADAVYNGGANGWGSVQQAYDSLSTGQTLFISQNNSPYNERLVATTNHTTIASDGAWLVQPNSNEKYVLLVGADSSYGTYYDDQTVLVGEHNYDSSDTAGINRNTQVTTLNVGNASYFSPGDVIHVFEEGWEDTSVHGNQVTVLGPKYAGDSSGASNVGEFAVVEGVDAGSDEVYLRWPLNLPYPNFEQTHVGTMSFPAEDIHVTGLNIRGDPGHSLDENAITISLANECWIENMDAYDAGGDPLFISVRNHRCRFHGITMWDTEDKGINSLHHATRCFYTDIRGEPVRDYTIRTGAGGGSSWFDDTGTVDTLIDGLENERHSGSTYVHNVHWGGWFTRSRNVSAIGSSPNPIRFRSLECHVDGFSENGATGGNSVTFAQRPQFCTVRNGTIENRNTNNPVFNFRLEGLDPGTSREGNNWGEELHFEDIYIEDYGISITNLGSFHSEAIIDGLSFHNIDYGGTWLERSHVTSWDGYSSDRITDLEVTHD